MRELHQTDENKKGIFVLTVVSVSYLKISWNCPFLISVALEVVLYFLSFAL